MKIFSHKNLLKQRTFRHLISYSVLLSILLGIVIVPLEANHPQATINSIPDGLWWAAQTLTSVGYGDAVPVTGLGRLLGLVLIIMGTIMFGATIALISSTMSRAQEEFYWNRLFERIDRLEGELAELDKRTRFIVKHQHPTPEEQAEEDLAELSSESSSMPVDPEMKSEFPDKPTVY